MTVHQSFAMQVSVPEARQHLADVLPEPQTQWEPLESALGRVLAQPLSALVSHPSATESALDGLAARETDTVQATTDSPVRLRVVGESRAGQPYGGAVGAGEGVRIYTGAPLPIGTDAICPVEQLTDDGANHVLLRRPASPGDVRQEGADFRAGEVVMQAGQSLSAARLALAAALGHAAVPVRRPWRVALLSTGDEVVPPGQPLQAGQVYDSNSVGLSALLQQCGCQVIPLGHAPDDVQSLRESLQAAGGADLLLTSGGVSMGRYDFMRDLLIERGQVKFWKVRMRPGGPAILGLWDGLPVFGLPGNPVSSLVVFQVIVRPVLSGQAVQTLRLPANSTFPALADKTAYWRGVLQGDGVSTYPKQGSGVLRSLSDADALVVVPEGKPVQPGDLVDVILL